MKHFIYNDRCGLGYRKTVSVYYLLLHYPTRDLHSSYKLAINNCIVIQTILVSYLNAFENREVHKWSDN